MTLTLKQPVVLVPVVVKRSKLKYLTKYAGGVLNPNKQYYTRIVQSNHNPLSLVTAIAEGKPTHV